MSTYSLKRFTRAQFLASINSNCLLQLLDPFRAFFQRRGVALPALGDASNVDLEQLVKVLVTPDVDTPIELADALYYIHEMATHDGMDALLDVIPLEQLGCSYLELEPADVAVRAWLVDRPAMERTHAELCASRPRRFDYFQQQAGPVLPFTVPDEEGLKPLEDSLDRVYAGRNRGRGVRVFSFVHEVDCLFLVRHGDPYRREGTLEGGEASSVLYRPLRFDVVAYNARTGTLRVHAMTKWETSLYRGNFGQYLFGSMNHFPDTARYTLDPLRVDGDASLECSDVRALKFVELTELQLVWGGPYGEREIRRAKNLFAAMRHRSASLPPRPDIERASFAIHFRGAKKPRSLVIAPPNVAHYARDEDSAVVDEWLALRGFLREPESYEQSAEPVRKGA